MKTCFRFLVRGLVWLLIQPFKIALWIVWFLVGSTGALIVFAWEKLLNWSVDWGDWWREGMTQPHIVEHTVPLGFPVRELAKAKFRRLLFVLLGEEAVQGRLLTCWQDLDS